MIPKPVFFSRIEEPFGSFNEASRLGPMPSPPLRNHNVEHVSVGDLKPYPRNARTHSKKHKRQIAESIRRFGFTNPLLIDDANQIIAGHGRLEAAKILGWSTVPTLRISHLSDEEKRAYVLADNKLAEVAGWDPEILAIELQGLIDIDFDIELTGFETAEIDLVFDDALRARNEKAGPEDDLPDLPLGHLAVSHPGDLWILGDHRLLCGNALEAQSFQQLMADEKAQMVFSDAPYNVPIDGHVSGLGRVRHREFAMASGEMNAAQFTQFLQTAFGLLAANSIAGSIHYLCMDWRHLSEALQAGHSVYSALKNIVVWNKTNGGMGSFYRSKHELVLVWKNGTAPHINNFELGQHGRYRTNVWDYAGVNTFRSGRLEELKAHPTAKPVAMVADAIKDCSHRNGIILDPFGGSGTTLIAAERTGRKACLIELDPAYVDVSIRRWQALTGKAAVLSSEKREFDEIELSRSPFSASSGQKDPALAKSGVCNDGR
jgi:DNA modification methylase